MVGAGGNLIQYKQGNDRPNEIFVRGSVTRALNILTHQPPMHEYTILKIRLVDTFRYSERKTVAKILEEELNDSKPTKLMERMLVLFPFLTGESHFL